MVHDCTVTGREWLEGSLLEQKWGDAGGDVCDVFNGRIIVCCICAWEEDGVMPSGAIFRCKWLSVDLLEQRREWVIPIIFRGGEWRKWGLERMKASENGVEIYDEGHCIL